MSRSDAHCSAGCMIPYVFGNASTVRARTCARVFWWSWKRLTSDEWRSMCDSPCTIHSATDLPTPGPSLTHTAAADHSPLTSGVSPRIGMPSGVSEMRPLIAYFTPTDSSPTISGIRSSASSICGSKSACVNGNSVGDSAAASIDGISSGSCRIERCAYDPISRPTPSWRSYMNTSMSRTIGNSIAFVGRLEARHRADVDHLVHDRRERDARARHRGEQRAPDAARDHDRLGLDRPARGVHAPDRARARRRCPVHLGVREHASARPTRSPVSRMIVPARSESTTPTPGV